MFCTSKSWDYVLHFHNLFCTSKYYYVLLNLVLHFQILFCTSKSCYNLFLHFPVLFITSKIMFSALPTSSEFCFILLCFLYLEFTQRTRCFLTIVTILCVIFTWNILKLLLLNTLLFFHEPKTEVDQVLFKIFRFNNIVLDLQSNQGLFNSSSLHCKQ